MKLATVMIICLAWSACPAPAQPTAAASQSYRVEDIPLPRGEHSVDAVAFMPDGRLACCLSFEKIAFYHPATGEWRLFAEGLHQPLGLWPMSDRSILVAQRPELTLVTDSDGDGRADQFKTVSDQFGFSGNYAEWTFGPVRDSVGNLYFSLGTGSNGGNPQTNEVRGRYSAAGHAGRMNSPVPYRGWVMQVTPDGETRPFANGFREANGLGMDLEGRLFTIDNQGDFVGTSALFHVEAGKFYGHPHSLVWRPGFDRHPFDVPVAELDALRTRPAVVFPHGDMSNSPTQPLCDTTKGAFGPFAGQMFLGEMNSPRILRAMLEEVDGQLQGASAIFLEGHGLNPGNNRLAFAPDGKSLYVGQTKYGFWVGKSGLQRIVWTGRTPFEVQAMSLTETGFDLTLTQAVDPASAAELSSYQLRSYFYNYHEAYGSKKFDQVAVPITAVSVHDGGHRISLQLKDLRAWRVYDLRLPKLRTKDGTPLAHPWLVYNLKRLRRDTPPAPAPVPNPLPGRRRPHLPKGGIQSIGAPQVADSTLRAARHASEQPGLFVRREGGGYRVTESGRNVLVYNRDPISQPGGDHRRGHYVHPLYGLDGERMTEDMPADHLHHRGLFWAWTQLYVGDQRIGHPWEQTQMSWEVRDVKTFYQGDSVVLRARVFWKSPLWLDQRKRQLPILEEIATIRVHPSSADSQAIDFEISLRARAKNVRLGGAMNTKGYGGFAVRIPLPKDLRIECPDGKLEPDWKRPSRAAAWVDFSGSFAATGRPTGLAILTHPTTPGYPQGWTIRRQNSCQNPVYPGQQAIEISNRQPLVLRYRVVLHRSGFDRKRVQGFFDDYADLRNRK